MILQILLTVTHCSTITKYGKILIRTSDYNFVNNFIKPKKFNATVKNLTIYTESKDLDGSFNNIYIKKNTGGNNFQVTYAKKGVIKSNNNFAILELYNGESIQFS